MTIGHKSSPTRKKKDTQEDTGITFVTLSEAVTALEATGMDRKALGITAHNEEVGIRNAMMGQG